MLLYDGTSGKICGDVTDFPIEAGTRQGGIESPTVFNWFFDWVPKVAAYEIDQRFPNGWGIPYTYTTANDCHKRGTGQVILDIVHRNCSRYGQISFKKTKTQVFNNLELMKKRSLLNISGNKIENVKEFKYLRQSRRLDVLVSSGSRSCAVTMHIFCFRAKKGNL